MIKVNFARLLQAMIEIPAQLLTNDSKPTKMQKMEMK